MAILLGMEVLAIQTKLGREVASAPDPIGPRHWRQIPGAVQLHLMRLRCEPGVHAECAAVSQGLMPHAVNRTLTTGALLSLQSGDSPDWRWSPPLPP